jgi:hypothetical protein
MRDAITIHTELIPILYTRPGPPTNPNPLIVLEKTANAVTMMPRLLPATKKSWADLVFFKAHIPMTIHRSIYVTSEVNMIGFLIDSITRFSLLPYGLYLFDQFLEFTLTLRAQDPILEFYNIKQGKVERKKIYAK